MSFLVQDSSGVEIASSPCFARALRIMNTLDGAVRIVRDDGVELATRAFLNAATVSEWLHGLGRWAS